MIPEYMVSSSSIILYQNKSKNLSLWKGAMYNNVVNGDNHWQGGHGVSVRHHAGFAFLCLVFVSSEYPESVSQLFPVTNEVFC